MKFDDVGVLKACEDFHLALEEMLKFIVSDEFIPFDHLDGHLLSSIITESLIDLAELPLPHHFSQFVAMLFAADSYY